MAIDFPEQSWEPDKKAASKDFFSSVSETCRTRSCIAVAGMHRSGTSAITGALALLGCELPRNLYGPDEGNEKGYFEPEKIIELNDMILASAGLLYQDWEEFPPDWKDSPLADQFRRRMSALIAEEYGSSLFIIKDPRICRVLPTLAGALQDLNVELRFLLPYRPPLEVALSIKMRGGLLIEHGLLMWIRYLLEAEYGSRGFTRAFISYERFLADWRCEVARIESQLDLRFPRKSDSAQTAVDTFLEHRLKHFDDEIDWANAGGLTPWLMGIEQAYERLTKVPTDPAVLDQLDQISAEFDRSSRHFHSTIKKALTRLNEETHRANGFQAELGAAQERSSESARASAAQISRLEAELDAAQERSSESARASAAQISRLEAELDAAQERSSESARASAAQIEELTRVQEDLSAQLALTKRAQMKMRSSFSWRLTRPLRSIKTISKRLIKTNRGSTLKPQFDPVWYLAANPDVAVAGVDPLQHYLEHGQREGRLGVRPHLKCKLVETGYDSAKETVVVVSHDASRTGAPILALNIIEAMRLRYNVVAIVLSDGSIIENFRAAANVVVGPFDAKFRHTPAVHPLIDQVCETYRPIFAVVNSIESRGLLRPLDDMGVPTILLIHEFASYVRPLYQLRDAIQTATEVVYSARLVWENTLAHLPTLAFREVLIAPQGQVRIPRTISAVEETRELIRIKEGLRPASAAPDTVVVIGCGYVQLRKGLQFFLAAASALVRSATATPFRFVWIGGGYNPRDDFFSALIEEQIHRAGIRDQFTIVDEVTLLDHVYDQADIFFLSSLLDPFPNVAIDAMLRGLPIVCFDQASGVGEILSQDALCRELVVPYGAVDVAAARILELGENHTYRDRISTCTRALAEQVFNMSSYVRQLEELGRHGIHIKHQENIDIATIESDSSFDAHFFGYAEQPALPRDSAIRAFVRRSASRTLDRRPCPGFHPGIYAENHPTLLTAPFINPFAHYIRQGKPPGDWTIRLIEPGKMAVKRFGHQRVALQLHLFYPDLTIEFVEALSHNFSRCDLLVSIGSDTSHAHAVENALRSYTRGNIHIQPVPNRGRDLGPLLTHFGDRILSDYDIIGHLHTKRSLILGDSRVGDNWRRFCVAHLLGGHHPMMDVILSSFADEPTLGLVFPDDPNVWPTNNNRALDDLKRRMGIDVPVPNYMFFPLGTMFWARTKAIAPLFKLQLKWGDYPDEPLPYDGTILHAIERILTVVTRDQGFTIAATHVPGVTR